MPLDLLQIINNRCPTCALVHMKRVFGKQVKLDKAFRINAASNRIVSKMGPGLISFERQDVASSDLGALLLNRSICRTFTRPDPADKQLFNGWSQENEN